MGLITLLVLSSTIVYCHCYLKRQELINDQIQDKMIAESLVKMSDKCSCSFNQGVTHRISQSKWQVTLSNSKRVQVTT